jgi:hypothetical protein
MGEFVKTLAAPGCNLGNERRKEAGKMKTPTSNSCDGAIAQLGERIVRNDEVVGSSPTSSTKSHALGLQNQGVEGVLFLRPGQDFRWYFTLLMAQRNL